MIGVFDSGFGGLTVHRALIESLPTRDFVYFGDNRNAPYGARSPIDVLNLTCHALDRLFAEGATLVVLACNTASVVALRWIQQQWLPVRLQEDGIPRNVIGIAVPTIEAATALPSAENPIISVFATQRTVDSGVYPLEIRKRRPEITVLQQPCPHLAGAIEDGAPRSHLKTLVDTYVAQMLAAAPRPPDSVILACTHYPLVADLFSAALPPEVRMIDQPHAVAQSLKPYLDRHPEYDDSHGAARRFLSTGFSPAAIPLIERFWGAPLPFLEA